MSATKHVLAPVVSSFFSSFFSCFLAATLAVTLAAGCGSSTSRESARSQATTQTCQRFATCMLIGDGAGKSYPTDAACEIDWQARWDQAWPAANCDGKINQQGFETCLAAIRSTACNPVDFGITVLKCDKSNVCPAMSTTPDGG